MRLPWDEKDEAQVVGIAIGSRHGAWLASKRVRVDDFFGGDGRLMTLVPMARMFAAAIELDEISGVNERIAAVAERADVPEEAVRRLVDGTQLMWDTNGQHARVVRNDARARAVMLACADAYETIGNDGPTAVDSALALLLEVTNGVRA